MKNDKKNKDTMDAVSSRQFRLMLGKMLNREENVKRLSKLLLWFDSVEWLGHISYNAELRYCLFAFGHIEILYDLFNYNFEYENGFGSCGIIERTYSIEIQTGKKLSSYDFVFSSEANFFSSFH